MDNFIGSLKLILSKFFLTMLIVFFFDKMGDKNLSKLIDKLFRDLQYFYVTSRIYKVVTLKNLYLKNVKL